VLMNEEVARELSEVPSRLGEVLSSGKGPRELLVDLCNLAIDMYNKCSVIFDPKPVGNDLEVAWSVVEYMVLLSNEYVLARYATILPLVRSIDLGRISDYVAQFLIRDLVTLIEKSRVMLLMMSKRGESWIELTRNGLIGSSG